MKRQFAVFAVASMFIAGLGLWFVPPMIANLWHVIYASDTVIGPVLTLSPAQSCSPAQLQQARQVLLTRLDSMELEGDYQVTVREAEQQVQVSLPPGSNTPQVISVITHEGDARFIDAGSQLPQIGQLVAPDAYPTLFAGENIEAMIPPDPNSGELFYTITLDPNSAERLENFNAGSEHYICLVVDNEVTTCSSMVHFIGNTLEILPTLASNDFSLADLEVLLTSGSLPTSFEIVD